MRAIMISILAVSSLVAAPPKWEKAIAKFEAAAAKQDPPKGALLFVGSSSVRLWDLKAALPERPTINHGFGGSELEDSLHFADRIIIPHKPAMVFLYAGDNDIQVGKSVERVVTDYENFVSRIHKDLPKTEIVFLAIKPSIARWKKWPEMNQANVAIQALAKKNLLLHYLDTAAPMIGEDGKPRADLFQKDGLHLNKEGYVKWNALLKKWLATKEAGSPSGE